jgi:hypothetical protein
MDTDTHPDIQRRICMYLDLETLICGYMLLPFQNYHLIQI